MWIKSLACPWLPFTIHSKKLTSNDFREEMRQRAEEDKKRKIEERAREKERKKEQAKLLKEVMAEWKKPRDDLDCEDLRALPEPTPIRCKIPNRLFGDFLTLLEFFECFKEVLEVTDR